MSTTYDEIKDLTARKAGQPRDKMPPADAEDFRDSMEEHLAEVWLREAWPETCLAFETATLASGLFTKAAARGAVLSLFSGGNPLTTAGVTVLDDWVDNDVSVLVLSPGSNGTVYVEYQMPVPTLLDYGDAGLGATLIPVRFKFPLSRYCAADLCEDEDPIKAARLRASAENNLILQASRFSPPWWRRGRLQ